MASAAVSYCEDLLAQDLGYLSSIPTLTLTHTRTLLPTTS